MHKKKDILDKINQELQFLNSDILIYLNGEGGFHKERILNYLEKYFKYITGCEYSNILKNNTPGKYHEHILKMYESINNYLTKKEDNCVINNTCSNCKKNLNICPITYIQIIKFVNISTTEISKIVEKGRRDDQFVSDFIAYYGR